MTSPSYPVISIRPLPGILTVSTSKTLPPTEVQARPLDIPVDMIDGSYESSEYDEPNISTKMVGLTIILFYFLSRTKLRATCL